MLRGRTIGRRSSEVGERVACVRWNSSTAVAKEVLSSRWRERGRLAPSLKAPAADESGRTSDVPQWRVGNVGSGWRAKRPHLNGSPPVNGSVGALAERLRKSQIPSGDISALRNAFLPARDSESKLEQLLQQTKPVENTRLPGRDAESKLVQLLKPSDGADSWRPLDHTHEQAHTKPVDKHTAPSSWRNTGSESILSQLLRPVDRSASWRLRNRNEGAARDPRRQRRDTFSEETPTTTTGVTTKLLKEALLQSLTGKGPKLAADLVDSKEQRRLLIPARALTLLEFSHLLRVKVPTLTSTLELLGERIADEKIPVDIAELVALELGFDPVVCTGSSSLSADKDYDGLPIRPPVVCIMGHVDHGKTTLMDALRRRSSSFSAKENVKNVAGTEAGGITQAISAFQIFLPTSDTTTAAAEAVTFLDTPGHAAFKSMRQSGSNGADVIILVIAADDGVSTQTVEILNMYKSLYRQRQSDKTAPVSLVVAMTKIDKHGTTTEESQTRIENQLMNHDIYTERIASSLSYMSEYGAVQFIPVSSHTGQGLDDLVEGLVLQSQIMDLRADVHARGEGIIMDARAEKGLGTVADCIVRMGVLEQGSVVVSGIHSGKIRIMYDGNGKSISKASSSQPVRIIGFKTLPKAGDPIVCVQSEEIAKKLITRREALLERKSLRVIDDENQPELQITGTVAKQGAMTQSVMDKYGIENKSENDDDNNNGKGTIRIPVVIKADADGTLEAVRNCLLALGDESKLDLCIDAVSAGIGPISMNDVRLASESGASIFCFNVTNVDRAATELAEVEGVKIRSHDVIYHLLDDAKEVFSTLLPPVAVDKIYGHATVQAVFDVNNKKTAIRVAGLRVIEGTIYRDKSTKDKGAPPCLYRVKRNAKILGAALKAKSLRRAKEDVNDVRQGDECGLGLIGYSDLEKGDVIECYSTEMKNMFV